LMYLIVAIAVAIAALLVRKYMKKAGMLPE
jgi:hypothetical protein